MIFGSDSKEAASKAGDPGSVLSGEDPLEKGMSTHSSILAWRVPWTEEPDGLQFVGSHRVKQEGATSTSTFPVGPQRAESGVRLFISGRCGCFLLRQSHRYW